MGKHRRHPSPARHARPQVHSPARPAVVAGVTVAGLMPLTAMAYPAHAAAHQAAPVHRAPEPAPRHLILTGEQRRALHYHHLHHLAHLRYLAWLRAQHRAAGFTPAGRDGDGDHDGDTADHPSATRADRDGDHDGDVSDAAGQAAPAAAPGGGIPSGTLGCSGLETLWVSAGGRASAEVTAADIAMAESGGRQYATGQVGERGYWQINPVNGALSTYDAYGNARAAVIMSGDGTNWSPWTTWTSGAYARSGCGGTVTAAVVHRVHSSPRPAGSSTDLLALGWAETQAGKPYIYGGNGPYGYDCSGLVVAAYARLGIMLPRTTFDMLGSAHLVRVTVPREGDLAFFGSGHVEFYIRPGVTYGAQQSGTRIGFHPYGGWWQPSMFFAVR
jgi:cell wall-associated NlpC family hydrolase